MEKIVFTNGCFDLLHPGHVDLLARARALGTRLVVGINSDESVRAIKGAPRPFCTAEERREVLLGLKSVDEVRIFSESTPERLIREISPDVLVKGGDWRREEIVGADFVLRRGGEVYSLPLKQGFSSSRIVEKILAEEAGQSRSNSGAKKKLRGETEIESRLRAIAETFEKLRTDFLPEIEKCFDLFKSVGSSGGKIRVSGNLPKACPGAFDERFGLVWKPVADEKKSGEDDLVIFLSEAGDEKDILEAAMAARLARIRTMALCGRAGKKLASLCDASLLVPSENGAEIQAAQTALLNLWRELSERDTNYEK